MIKSKSVTLITAILMSLIIIFLAVVALSPDSIKSITASEKYAYESEMDKNKILSFEITADEADWQNMLDNATSEEYIMADIKINGTTIKSVGIRPKGNSSLSMVASDDTTDRYSFKIEFDHYIKGQTWLGLDKIVLNNIQSDNTYMKEYISYDLMNYIGVDTPIYAYADIKVNGSTWGFYLAVEALEDSYLARTYNSEGKLYKPESMGMRGNGQMNEIINNFTNNEGNTTTENGNTQNQWAPDQMPKDTNMQPPEGWPDTSNMPNGGMSSNGVSLQYVDDEIESYSAIFDNAVFDSTNTDYKRVIEAIKNINNGIDLEKYIDIDACLKYFAAHTVIVNLDSYVSNMGHNYYLYENDGQITILPWDFNLAFGGFQSSNASDVVNFPIDTPVSGVSLSDRPLLGKLLEVESYKEKYHQYLNEIVEGYFNNGYFENTVNSLTNQISEYVKNDPTSFCTYEEYQQSISEFIKLGNLRAKSIEGQLEGIIPSTNQGQESTKDLLLDASTINLTALGSQGGNNMKGFNIQNFNNEDGEDSFGGRPQRHFNTNNSNQIAPPDQNIQNQENNENSVNSENNQGNINNTPQNFPSKDFQAEIAQQGMLNTTIHSIENLIITGVTLLILFSGIIFAKFYKRRG